MSRHAVRALPAGTKPVSLPNIAELFFGEKATDTVIKFSLFWLAPLLLNYFVYEATGVPLHESIRWWLANFSEAPRMVLLFGLLAALTFAGFSWGVVKDLYQSLVSRPVAALYLGYHDGQEHYLVEEDGRKRRIAINHLGRGESRLDRVYQPASLMFNPLGQQYWPQKENRDTPLFLLLAATALLFALMCLGEPHILYMDIHTPGLLGKLQQERTGENGMSLLFLKSLYEYTAVQIPFLLVLSMLGGGLVLQDQQLRQEVVGNLLPVPANCAPGAILSATLVDTAFERHGLNSRADSALDGPSDVSYSFFGIFEIGGIYPHPVWVSAYLGTDTPADRDDGRYPTLDNEYERRTQYENASPVYERLVQLKALRPIMQLRLTEDWQLNWIFEPALAQVDSINSR